MILVEFVSGILKDNYLVLIIAGILGSYLVTSQSLPFIIYFSKVKNLTAKVDERSSHTSNIHNNLYYIQQYTLINLSHK